MNSFEEVVEQDFSLFGAGIKVKGEFEVRGMVRISAHLDGMMKSEDPNAHIIIEQSGSFQGKLLAATVEIFGSFSGEIFAGQQVILRPTAHFEGTISSKSFQIFPGAVTNMKAITLERGQEKASMETESIDELEKDKGQEITSN